MKTKANPKQYIECSMDCSHILSYSLIKMRLTTKAFYISMKKSSRVTI